MRSRIVFPVLLLLCSCTNYEDGALLRQAEMTYLEVKLGQKSDSTGRAYFKNMSVEIADKLHDLLAEHLRQLELDDTNPQKHFDAGCNHSFGYCKIKSNIENFTGTLTYMLEARR